MKAADKPRRDFFFQWTRELMIWKPSTEADLNILRKAKQSKEQNWLRLTRFVCFVAHDYGTYGEDIWPSQVTMAEETGISQRTISRYLDAADGLRFFTVEKASTPGRLTTVRNISAFWEPAPTDLQPVIRARELVSLGAEHASASPDPWGNSDNPWSNSTEEPPF